MEGAIFLTMLVAVAALIVAVRSWNRIAGLAGKLANLDIALSGLSRRFSELERKLTSSSEVAKTVVPEEKSPIPQQILPAVPAQPPPIVASEAVRGPRPAPSVEHRPIMIPATEAPSRTPPPTLTAPIRPPLPPAPPLSPPKPSQPPGTRPGFDWERLIGVKLFSWISGIALTIAAIFFLRYSIEAGWLQPQVRMAIGILVGIALLLICELKAARNYPITANALDASAIAILFATFFAAHALWKLIGTLPSFVLLVIVTALAVLLSIRRSSLFIALLGLVGGFSTPALLSTGENRPISLFGYLLLLNAGLAWVAAKKKWPLLTSLSLVLTTIYQWSWVGKFLTAGQLPLAAGIFLVFPILSFAAISLGRAEGGGRDWKSLFGQTAGLSAILPVFFALYLATVPAYGESFGILFGFLFCLDAGLFAIAMFRGPEILHLGSGLSTLLVFAVWFMFSYRQWAWPAILPFVALFVLFYLVAPFLARRFHKDFAGLGKRAVLAAPMLLYAFPVLAFIESSCASPGLLFTVLFLLLAAAAATAILSEKGAIHFVAAFFALAAEGVWSARYLTQDRLIPGLVLYAVFGLFFLGVPLIARRYRKTFVPESAGGVLLLASLALLFFLAAGPAAQSALWGLALLLGILNAGLFIRGSSCRSPMHAIAGIVLSWIILAVWWSTATVSVILVPALVVVTGFAVLAMAGNLWMQKRCTSSEAALLGNGLFLGLVGHLFLLYVALQKSLAIPPWPLLGVLAVLDLAIGAAALYTRRGELHLAAIAASALILMLWVAVAEVRPWPSVAIYSAGLLAVLGLVWLHLASRFGIKESRFTTAAVTGVLMSEVVAVIGGIQAGSPGVGFLVSAHVLLLVALLWLARHEGWSFLAPVGVAIPAAACLLWQVSHSGPEFWKQDLAFLAPIYAVFLAYPLVLGRRAGCALAPYLAAVLASVPFFFLARQSLMAGGFGHVIGILPVIQAILLGVLLINLLRIEAPGERALGRLALVAGTALAFITVAIPLQLEKEWITIGWALEGAALAWLYGKIPHRGLLLASSGLMVAVFVRLALNPSVLTYSPRGSLRLWNWYLYTYLVSAAAMFLAGWLLHRTKDTLVEGFPRVSTLLPGGGAVLLFLLVNIEIADFYSTGESIIFNFSATLAQDLTYTLAWAVFALGLLGAGIAMVARSARIASIVLLAATVLKCFLHDFARLGGLYRVASFVGLAVCLALVAILLQKFVLGVPKEAK